MCCESNRRAFWSVLSGFMLLSVSGYTQTNRASLPSSAGKELKVPYAPMALNAELIGPAISEKDWFNWCVSPIQGRMEKYIFSAAVGRQLKGWRAGTGGMPKSLILSLSGRKDLLLMSVR